MEEESDEPGSLICILCCVSFQPGKNGQLINGDDDNWKNNCVEGRERDHDYRLKTFSKFCDEVTATCKASLSPPPPRQLAVIKTLPQFSSKLIDGDGMSVCLDCLKGIEVTMETKEKVDTLECHVRSLQVEILRELRQLEGILEEYNSEMGRIKEVVRGSDWECQKIKEGTSNDLGMEEEEELESGILLLRECILEGSSIQSNFTDNISFHHPKIEVEVNVKIEEDDDDGGPLDFEYSVNFDDNYNEDVKNLIEPRPRKSERARKPVDMFIPNNFLEQPPPTIFSNSMLTCASEYLEKERKKADKKNEDDKPFKCGACGEQGNFATKRELQRHKKRNHGGKARKFKCTICEQEFSCKSYLKRHIVGLHGGKGVSCEKCGKICLSVTSLKNHMISHSEERNWTCELCGKGFKRRMGLKLHERVHREEKNWKCGFCEKAFTRKEYWQMHERTHTGERPYVCDLCGKAFNQKTSLSIHRRNQHDKRGKARGRSEVGGGGELMGSGEEKGGTCSEMGVDSLNYNVM